MPHSVAGHRFYQRLVVAGITASVSILAFALSVQRPWSPDAPLVNDFISFWMAGSLVHEGVGPALYDMGLQQSFQTNLRLEVATLESVRQQAGFLIPYHNPPALALLFAPLTLLPLFWGWLFWSALNLLAIGLAVALPLRGTPRAATVALALLTFGAVPDALLWGQMAGILVLAITLGLLALTSCRPFIGGVLLGLLWLKPQYAAVFALVLLVKGRWRELAGMAVVGLVTAAISFAVVGLDGAVSYLELLRRIGDFDPPPESLVKPYAMVNWRSLLVHLWPGISPSAGSALVLLLGGGTVLAALLACRGRWEPASPRFPRQMLVVVLATLVASPHSHVHGAVLLLAPLSMALARPLGQGTLDPYWRPMLVLGYGLGQAVWLLDGVPWLMVPYSIVAMGLLILHLGSRVGQRTICVEPSTDAVSHLEPRLP